MNQHLRKAAALGKGRDSMIAHVSPGEIVVPSSVQEDNPAVMDALRLAFFSAGRDLNQFTVGEDARRNARTGLAMFDDSDDTGDDDSDSHGDSSIGDDDGPGGDDGWGGDDSGPGDVDQSNEDLSGLGAEAAAMDAAFGDLDELGDVFADLEGLFDDVAFAEPEGTWDGFGTVGQGLGFGMGVAPEIGALGTVGAWLGRGFGLDVTPAFDEFGNVTANVAFGPGLALGGLIGGPLGGLIGGWVDDRLGSNMPMGNIGMLDGPATGDVAAVDTAQGATTATGTGNTFGDMTDSGGDWRDPYSAPLVAVVTGAKPLVVPPQPTYDATAYYTPSAWMPSPNASAYGDQYENMMRSFLNSFAYRPGYYAEPRSVDDYRPVSLFPAYA